MNIVKAEILWSRRCLLKCDYCSMADGRKNESSLQDWKRGIDSLKQLDCGFIAFYGAEPLVEFNKLPHVIGYAESLGIHTTIITSGKVKNFSNKLDVLHDQGAKSLSMSYDIVPINKSSRQKTSQAIEGLLYFLGKRNIRDVAAIATITSSNYDAYPQMIKEMSKRNIWSFFDLIHRDRGQEGTKCRNFNGIEDLLFTDSHVDSFIDVLKEVAQLKEKKYLVHSSHYFLNMLINNPDYLLNYNWNCALEDNFPAWVTVDVDMMVYPCDDFQLRRGRKFNLINLKDEWNDFNHYWKPIVKTQCPGCLWNTHIDAHAIKRGSIGFNDYIHI